MSRLFLEDGTSIPVTVISVCGNFVADIKTSDRDGYDALVVSKTKKSNNLTKSTSEFFKKVNLEPGKLAEFRTDSNNASGYQIGNHLTADVFETGQYVDITGTSKGKGYANGPKSITSGCRCHHQRWTERRRHARRLRRRRSKTSGGHLPVEKSQRRHLLVDDGRERSRVQKRQDDGGMLSG